MDHRRYTQYSLNELYEALDTVDEVEYPGQRATIEARIDAIESEHSDKAIIPNSGGSTGSKKVSVQETLISKILGFMGILFLSLGLLGLFPADPDGLHPIFKNRSVVLALAVIGAILIVTHLRIMTPIWKTEGRTKKRS